MSLTNDFVQTLIIQLHITTNLKKGTHVGVCSRLPFNTVTAACLGGGVFRIGADTAEAGRELGGVGIAKITEI